MRPLHNRHEAGKVLAQRLGRYATAPDLLVLALPRGGVPVAYEIARALQAPLDVFVVRKLGAPSNEELAIGAIASGGMVNIDERSVALLGIQPWQIEEVVRTESRELARREQVYHRGRAFPSVVGRTVIVVDDGLATGATMRAAIEAIRSQHPAAVIAAAPVGSRDACEMIESVADDCICAITPEPFGGVGAWYRDFTQTTDEEVLALLDAADMHMARAHAPAATPVES